MNTGYLREMSFHGMNPNIVEEVDENNTYIGYLKPNSSTESDATKEGTAMWVIKKVSTANGITTIKFADGSRDYNKEWDNRATYTYKY